VEKWITQSNVVATLLDRCGKPVDKNGQLSTFPHIHINLKKLSTSIAHLSTCYPHVIHRVIHIYNKTPKKVSVYKL
jgi:hypothetical protein